MIFDRPYMRDAQGRSPHSALKWLIIGIAGVFVLENIFVRWFGGSLAEGFFRCLTLSPSGLKSGFIWTLLSHGVIHHPDSLLGLGFTLLALFVFGRAVEPDIGNKRLLQLFAASVIIGGATWLGVNWNSGESLYGASAGVSALMILFACLHPDQPITIFMIDIGMRAKHLAYGMLAIAVLGLILVEIPSHASWFAMAHSAHLGGMVTGWLYYRFIHTNDSALFTTKRSIELPRWFKRGQKKSTPPPVFKVNLSTPDTLMAEVDRILDKSNSQGFHSLTEEEKRHLDQAREQLNRRR